MTSAKRCCLRPTRWANVHCPRGRRMEFDLRGSRPVAARLVFANAIDLRYPEAATHITVLALLDYESQRTFHESKRESTVQSNHDDACVLAERVSNRIREALSSVTRQRSSAAQSRARSGSGVDSRFWSATVTTSNPAALKNVALRVPRFSSSLTFTQGRGPLRRFAHVSFRPRMRCTLEHRPPRVPDGARGSALSSSRRPGDRR